MFTILTFLTLLSTTADARGNRIKTLVTFGDSYTDQSRLTFFESQNAFPPKDFKQEFPPVAFAADGGASWVRYAEIYGDVKSWNYAVSGAACSNLLTPRPGEGPSVFPDGNFPAVQDYEIPAFMDDHITTHSRGRTTNDLDSDTTVYSLWIGTNDVGFGSLLTGNQTAGTTIVDFVNCTIDWMEKVYALGGRNFIFQNMIPLQHTPLYANIPAPLTRYWPFPHNITQYAIEMSELVAAGNALLNLQVPATLAKLPGAKAAIFDSYQLFTDMFNNPSKFLNGTAPLNVTGYQAHTNLTGGDLMLLPSADSFLWFDALHPSEQASRQVAREMVRSFNGSRSQYATFFGSDF